MRYGLKIIGVLSVLGLVACSTPIPITQQQGALRSPTELRPLDYHAPAAPYSPPTTAKVELVNQQPAAVIPQQPLAEQYTGKYTFTVPATVTRVLTKTENFQQYQIYWGQPGPTDTPFVIITIGADVQADVNATDSFLTVERQRGYVLNDLPVQEWTGYTTGAKLPFCELLATRPGGWRLRALGIARTPEMRETLLAILGSIRWEPTAPAQP